MFKPNLERKWGMTTETPFLIYVYAAYAAICVPLIVWLARTLSKNGAVFLEDVFADNPRLAAAVNQLLVVGFYLLNLGYACMLLRAGPVGSATAAVEALAFELGLLLISLGGMHFVNMYVLHRIRRRAQVKYLPPPVAPQMRLSNLETAVAAR
jgi:hypothetical protein